MTSCRPPAKRMARWTSLRHLVKRRNAAAENNTWAFITILFDNVARQCADEVEANWGDRLGGVDIFTFDHCWKISEHQRID